MNKHIQDIIDHVNREIMKEDPDKFVGRLTFAEMCIRRAIEECIEVSKQDRYFKAAAILTTYFGLHKENTFVVPPYDGGSTPWVRDDEGW